jgi:hypothetical protein
MTDAERTPSCDEVEHHQFDFWLGDWDVFGPTGKLAGRNRVSTIAGGCALLEEWLGVGGVLGTSLNTWSKERSMWHQTWVDSSGALLLLDGGLRDGVMVLEGTTIDPERPGGLLLHRISWSVVDKVGNELRQHWQTSADGRRWDTSFDGRYARRK